MLLRVIHGLEALLGDLNIHFFASHLEFERWEFGRRMCKEERRKARQKSENLRDDQRRNKVLLLPHGLALGEEFGSRKECVDPIEE
jgi:hypothetical protein